MDEVTAIDANLNIAKCLVHKTAIGHDVITNICTGTITHVPWQASDWFIAFTISGMTALVLSGLLAIAFTIYDTLRY